MHSLQVRRVGTRLTEQSCLALLLVRTRHQLTQRNEIPSCNSDNLDKMPELIVLRLELGQLLTAGTIDQDVYDRTTGRIDALWSTMLTKLRLTPDTQQWQTSREAAWAWLSQQHALPSPLPPWHAKKKAQLEQAPAAGRKRWTNPADSAAPAVPRRVHGTTASCVAICQWNVAHCGFSVSVAVARKRTAAALVSGQPGFDCLPVRLGSGLGLALSGISSVRGSGSHKCVALAAPASSRIASVRPQRDPLGYLECVV